MSSATESKEASAPLRAEDAWLHVLTEKVRSIRFGTVLVKIHDSQVVLIERTEQTRFDLSGKRQG